MPAEIRAFHRGHDDLNPGSYLQQIPEPVFDPDGLPVLQDQIHQIPDYLLSVLKA